MNFRYAAIVFLSCTAYAGVLRAESLKSYSCPEMGISFNYPEDWTVRLSTGSLHSSNPPHITLTHPEKEHYVSGDIMPVTVVFISVEKRGNQSLEQWAAKDASLFDEKSLQPLQARSQIQRRKVAGFTALDRWMETSRAGESWEPTHRKIYIERQDLVYTIFGVNQFLGSEQFNKFFGIILNSWQFL